MSTDEPQAGGNPVKYLVIGCCIIAFLMVGGCVLTVHLLLQRLPEAVDQLKETAEGLLEQERQRQALANQWRPPAEPLAPEQLFPAEVNGLRRTAADEKVDLPEFTFQLPGHHARYENEGETVDVYVCKATPQEKDALFARMEAAHKGANAGTKVWVGLGYRVYLRENDQHYHAYWLNGWLLVVKVKGEEDGDAFAQAFLKARPQTPPATATAPDQP